MEEGGGVAPPRPREEPARFRGGWTCCVYQSLRGSLRLESHQRFLLMREAACCWPTQGKSWSRWRESNPRCGRTGTADFRYPTPAWRGRPESHRVWVGHSHPCRTVTLRPRIGVRPGGVAPPSGGYRPPVLRLNYGRLERPAGFAPAVSSLAGKRLAPRPRPREGRAGADGVEPSSRASKARSLPVGRGPSGGRVRTCTSQPEGTGVTARLRSCLGSAPGKSW